MIRVPEGIDVVAGRRVRNTGPGGRRPHGNVVSAREQSSRALSAGMEG